MTWEAIKTVVITFCSSTVGTVLLTAGINAIKTAIVNKQNAAKSKLLESDRKAIVDDILTAQKGRIVIDMRDELDGATRGLLNEFRGDFNYLVERNNTLTKVVIAQAKVISQFKTIQGTEANNELISVLAGVDTTDIPMLAGEVAFVVEETATEEKTKKSKVSY
ncbi:MAG: hypothetical protein IKA59_00855 [Clostridia bacterium]|nr:hypothetical protein [Clostridia bacterium]